MESRFSTKVKVRFAETDAQGVAHHAAYFVWLEMTRIEYLARFDGGYKGLREQGIDALTLEAFLRYLAPAHFDDVLTVRAHCGGARGARFRFDYHIVRGEEPVAEGWTSHACVDSKSLRPTRMPDWLATAITDAES
jgi:YbgC/YbaW family acyl-CoA thioester hydrolase